MKIDIIINPLVMAGGVGSWLWPLSRAAFPKQHQALLPQWFSFKHVKFSQSHHKVLRGIHDFYKGLI
jgi:mannose-1-phosphate guanylyltransferase